MSPKVCPVCKAFSSTSNTTLNAHMDQCLTAKPTAVKPVSRRVVRKLIIYKVQQKKRSMAEIYATSLRSTLEDLDRRNGSNWAVVCNQIRRPMIPQVDITDNGSESMGNFDSKGATIQILLNFDDALTQPAGEVCNQNEETVENLEGERISVNKKRPYPSNELYSLELSEGEGYIDRFESDDGDHGRTVRGSIFYACLLEEMREICTAPKEKLVVEHQEKEESSVFQLLEVLDRTKSSESRTLKMWVSSKRTCLPKFNEIFSNGGWSSEASVCPSLMTEGTSSMADGCLGGEISSNATHGGHDKCDSNEISGAGSSGDDKLQLTTESERGAIDETSPSRSNIIEASPEGEVIVTSEIAVTEVGDSFYQFPSGDVHPFQSDRQESAAEDVQVNFDTVITPSTEKSVGNPVISSEDQVTAIPLNTQLDSFPSLTAPSCGSEEQGELTASKFGRNQQTHCANEIGNEAVTRSTPTVEIADPKGKEDRDFISESQSKEHETDPKDFLSESQSSKLLLTRDGYKSVDLSPSKSPLPAILSNSPSHKEKRSELKNLELDSSLGSPTILPSAGDATQLSLHCVLPTESNILGAERTNLDRENETETLSPKRPEKSIAAPLPPVNFSTYPSSRTTEVVIPFSELHRGYCPVKSHIDVALTKFLNSCGGLGSRPSQTRPLPESYTVVRLMGQNLVVKNKEDEPKEFQFFPLGSAPENCSASNISNRDRVSSRDGAKGSVTFGQDLTRVPQTSSQPPRIYLQTQQSNHRPNTLLAYDAWAMTPHMQYGSALLGFHPTNSSDIGTRMAAPRATRWLMGSIFPERVSNSNLVPGNMYPHFHPMNGFPVRELAVTPQPSYQMSRPGASASTMPQGGTSQGSGVPRCPFIFPPPPGMGH